MAALTDGWVAVSYTDGIYIAKADPSLISIKPLKVMGQSWELPHDAFRAAHPDIPLELDERFPQSLEMLYADIISGSGADVYVLEANVHDIPLMAEKGYLADLSGDPALAQAVGGMYPYIQRAAAPGGRVTALPVAMGPTWSMMGYYPESFAQIGLGRADVPLTYGDFLSFVEAWQNGAGDAQGDMTLFGNTQMSVFRKTMVSGIFNSELIHCARKNEPPSLDAQRVLPLLERIDRIHWDDGTSASSQGPLSYDQEITPCLFTNYHLSLENVKHYQREGLMPMPLATAPDMEPVTDVRLTLLAVSAGSQNPDAAMAYLRIVLENLQPAKRAELMPGLNEPISDPYRDETLDWVKHAISTLEESIEKAQSAEKRELEQRLALHQTELDDLMENEYYIGPKIFQSFREYAGLLDIPPVNALTGYGNEEMDALSNRYRDKQISPAEYIEEVNRKLMMMHKED